VYAEDSPSAPTVGTSIERGRCVDKFVFFKESAPCGFYVSMFGFSKADNCGGGVAGCEDVLKVEEGAMHSSCVKEDGCDGWMRVGV